MLLITTVRRVTRLMRHIEDLCGLNAFTKQEVQILQDALLLLIAHEQHASSKRNGKVVRRIPLPVLSKTYEFQQRTGEPNGIVVHEAGEPDRCLRHVPIFSYGFGLDGLSGLDVALAILADYFSEVLSLRVFAEGTAWYCRYFVAFARRVLPRLRTKGQLGTAYILAFLQDEMRRNQQADGIEPMIADEKLL